jgi:hypothetical protein
VEHLKKSKLEALATSARDDNHVLERANQMLDDIGDWPT